MLKLALQMAIENTNETNWQAINMLTDRFSLCLEHIQNLLKIASGDQVIVGSALLTARELGESPYEGAWHKK